MTRADLHAHEIGKTVETKGFQAMLIYLGENIPKPSRNGRDATTILNDEGFTQGYLKALEEIRNIHLSVTPLKRETVQNYQAPETPDPKKK